MSLANCLEAVATLLSAAKVLPTNKAAAAAGGGGREDGGNRVAAIKAIFHACEAPENVGALDEAQFEGFMLGVEKLANNGFVQPKEGKKMAEGKKKEAMAPEKPIKTANNNKEGEAANKKKAK
jgi:hypothetical protein